MRFEVLYLCQLPRVDVVCPFVPIVVDGVFRYIRSRSCARQANCPILLHEHNEYIPRDVFLKGIDVYCGILPALANFPAETASDAAEAAKADKAAAPTTSNAGVAFEDK